MSYLTVQLVFVMLAIVTTACQRGGDAEKDVSSQPQQPVDNCSSVLTMATDEDSLASSSAAVVHRKHKKIHRSAAITAAAATTSSLESSSLGTESNVPLAPVHPYRKPANPYVAYRNIKTKVGGWRFSVN